MSTRHRLLSTGGILVVATLLMALALLENTLAPWAPFYVAYAAVATILPLALGSFSFGPLRDLRLGGWAAAIACPVVIQVVGALWIGLLYPGVLRALGVGAEAASGPFYSLDAALSAVSEVASGRWHVGVGALQTAYLLFILLWAGLGEELFYRGYMHGALRRRHGFGVAALTSAAWFAARHATQLALVSPYPWGACCAWVVFAFLAGTLFSWLYDRTGSLYPPVIAHYLLNLVPAAAYLLSPGG